MEHPGDSKLAALGIGDKRERWEWRLKVGEPLQPQANLRQAL